MPNVTSTNVLGIANQNNSYDYCGRMHNEILDYIIDNNPNPTDTDIYNLSRKYLQEQYDLPCDITFAETFSHYETTTSFITDAILSAASFDTIFSGEIIAGVLDSLTAYSNSILESNTLPTPQEYAEHLIGQENRIITVRETVETSQNDVSEYNIALGTLAIARYSYYYWYTVVNDTNSAWYFITNTSKQRKDNNPDTGFWGKLWDGICNVVENTVKVVVTPVVDATGFAWGAISTATIQSSPEGNPRLDLSLGEAIKTASDWSGKVW